MVSSDPQDSNFKKCEEDEKQTELRGDEEAYKQKAHNGDCKWKDKGIRGRKGLMAEHNAPGARDQCWY